MNEGKQGVNMDRIQREEPWSVTTRDMREGMRTLRETDEQAVVVTVADVEGSAYRRPGAKMLVGADGEPAGAVTAGCLEGPVTDLSMEVLSSGRPRVEVFDLMEDDGDTWGLGLGCNGIIDVYLEPLDGSWDRPLERLSSGEPVTLLTVIDSEDDDVPTGSRSFVDDDGESHAVGGREPVPLSVQEATVEAIEEVHGQGKAVSVDVSTDDGTVRVLVDGLEPVRRLFLFGSQNDIRPVCRLASTVGFDVTVHSPRGARDEETFPNAHHVRTGHPSTLPESIDAPAYTYAVVMSHSLVDDQLAVETLLNETSVPYVGLMGPRERFERVRDGAEGVEGEALDRIATPVGLDLGGGEPVEIALSIVSEVLAVSNGRAGGRLTGKKGPIHGRIRGSTE